MEDPNSSSDARKPASIYKRLWHKSGLTLFVVLLACKGGLPPILALAAYEADDWSDVYTTLGYLVAIMSHLTLAIQPRAKFLRSLVLSLLFTCTGAALALLQIQCVISARSAPQTGTAIGDSGSQEGPTYDAAACATAAVFLFVWVFLANCVKAARPQMTLPLIQFTIFVAVAATSSPSFQTMSAGISFVKNLLVTFLTGYALGAGVSLLILPTTSRTMVTKQLGGFMSLTKTCIEAQHACLHAIRNSKVAEVNPHGEGVMTTRTLKALVIKSNELLGKIKLEIGFARKEVAFGKLSPHHFSQIYNLVREAYQPVLGMSTFLEIVSSLREDNAGFFAASDVEHSIDAIREIAAEEWDDLIAVSHVAYANYQDTLLSGFQHVAYQLELEPRPQAITAADVEKDPSATLRPGNKDFTHYLDAQLRKYHTVHTEAVQQWARSKNLSLPKNYWRPARHWSATHQQSIIKAQAQAQADLNQHQLYMILYMRFLHSSLSKALLKLARYADGLTADGTMTRRRFINPGTRRLHKLFTDVITKPVSDGSYYSNEIKGGSNIYLGDTLYKKRDPEHLPPTNTYEKVTDTLRKVPALLASEAVSFGFRAAVATMSIAIIGFLRQTRPFFQEQRGVWALIMVAISMDPYAGQGMFGFVTRIGGTAFAMVAAIVIWYMCNHNHIGILVVFWIYMSGWTLFILKFPQFAIIGMISSITVVLILGYELQVDVIGRELATSNGQAYYPVELLGVYRLGSVCAGLLVAFIWTYLPFPVTTHGALRRELGNTLYILGNFYSCVHSTIDARLRIGATTNHLPTDHPVRKLDAAREKIFGKALLSINQLHEHVNFSRFEFSFGGRFPRQRYLDLVGSVQTLLSYIALIEYASNAFIEPNVERDVTTDRNTESTDSNPTSQNVAIGKEQEKGDRWMKQLRAYVANSNRQATTDEITSILCSLSNAIRNAQPLPPHLEPPRPPSQRYTDSIIHMMPTRSSDGRTKPEPEEEVAKEEKDDLLSIEHFAHPAYAAFAVGEVTSSLITVEMSKITKVVKELVGEVNFAFQIDEDTTSLALSDAKGLE